MAEVPFSGQRQRPHLLNEHFQVQIQLVAESSWAFAGYYSQLPSMLIARAATAMIVTNEITLSSIINNLAREVSGKSGVGLNPVAVSNARNK